MAPSQRRRSIDSSSSSSPGTSPGTHDHQSHLPNTTNNKTPSEPGRHTTSRDAQWSLPNTNDVSYKGDKHEPPPGYTTSTSTTVQPPVSTMPPVPPSGYRIPLSVPGPPFPGVERTRRAPFTDLNGTPVFIGSAITQHSVHPCKIAPNSSHPCYVAYGGAEILHQGRYDLLPFVPEHMEFVPTSHGQIPPGRRPIKGGFEHDGTELYHAVAVIDGVKVPGKTGTHLGGCNVPFGGIEHSVKEKYEIL